LMHRAQPSCSEGQISGPETGKLGGRGGSRSSVLQVETEMTKKKNQEYPAGWDEKRIRKLAERYDNQTEDEQVAEHEAAFLAKG